jgi:DNA invertase Pin-like site-specific DNA recombinase
MFHFEREMMLELQRDGIAEAKAQGKYKGRKPTAQAKKAEVVAMLAQGRSKKDVAMALGVSERSVYRVGFRIFVKVKLRTQDGL